MYNPTNKGRWYRFFIEADETSSKITEGDIADAVIENDYLKMPEGFIINDVKIEVHSISGAAAQNVAQMIRFYNDGTQGIDIPAKSKFDWMYAYVHGYYGE